MKKIFSIFILLIFLLVSCGKECPHTYTKWSFDAENHWISCDLCKEVAIKERPHDWYILSAEEAEGMGLVHMMCGMCGQLAAENRPLDYEVTNEEWDEALDERNFRDVTVTLTENDRGNVYQARYVMKKDTVTEEILSDGIIKSSKALSSDKSEGKKYIISTLTPFIDTFGGFEFDENQNEYYYERTEEDGSFTSFTFGFLFDMLTYFKATSKSGEYSVEFVFSDYNAIALTS